jgi:asparagine synthase (glutamine-hydrolysing)
MCGIVGLLSRGTGEHNQAVVRARDLLAHRGPEGAGLWTTLTAHDAARVTLGHRRLCIIDVSERSSQPLLLARDGVVRPALSDSNLDAKLSLIFNGEIYNFVELRTELIARGHKFNTTGDAEVLLLSYAEWGESCLERLNGMFAFAIWDSERDLLFCARDRFGEKPFHYVLDAERGSFAFASEVKALIGMGVAEAELDERAVYRYFRFGEQAGVEQTIWRGVKRLLPSRAMRIRYEGGRLSSNSWRYWTLPDRSVVASDSESVAEFRQLFADSVRLRLRSDVPIGSSLSGGLDSSSVVGQVSVLGAAAGQLAFTAKMDDASMDESRYAKLVAERAGIRVHTVTPDADAFIEEFDKLFYHQEEPFPSTSILASYLVQSLASDHGVTVLLDGQGADEYLAGYAHYPAAALVDFARNGQLRKWWRERHEVLLRAAVDPVPPRAAAWHWWRSMKGAPEQATIDAPRDDSFLNSDLRKSFRGDQSRVMERADGTLGSRMRADLLEGHLQELLRYADRNSMAFSLETRLPFLDHRLVELVMSRPIDLSYRNGESKWLLRQSMRGIVPDEILGRRDKIGFVTPWDSWTRGTRSNEFQQRLAVASNTLDAFVTPGALTLASPAAFGVMAIASVLSQFRAIGVPVRLQQQ